MIERKPMKRGPFNGDGCWHPVPCQCDIPGCTKFFIKHPSIESTQFGGFNDMFIAQKVCDKLNAKPAGELSKQDKDALRWAVDLAHQWYGNITGDPDKEVQFMSMVLKSRLALHKLGIRQMADPTNNKEPIRG